MDVQVSGVRAWTLMRGGGGYTLSCVDLTNPSLTQHTRLLDPQVVHPHPLAATASQHVRTVYIAFS